MKDRTLRGYLLKGEQYGLTVIEEDEKPIIARTFDLDDAYRKAVNRREKVEREARQYDKNKKAFDVAATALAGEFTSGWNEPKPDLEAAQYEVSVLHAAKGLAMRELEEAVLRNQILVRVEEELWPLIATTAEDEDEMTVAQFRAIQQALPELREIVSFFVLFEGKSQGGMTPEEAKRLRQTLKQTASGPLPTLGAARQELQDKQLAAQRKAADEKAAREKANKENAIAQTRYRNPQPTGQE